MEGKRTKKSLNKDGLYPIISLLDYKDELSILVIERIRQFSESNELFS